MLITVTALLCLVASPSTCIERTVTDQATFAQCSGAFAMQALPAGWSRKATRRAAIGSRSGVA
jgi:hypothetical protein